MSYNLTNLILNFVHLFVLVDDQLLYFIKIVPHLLQFPEVFIVFFNSKCADEVNDVLFVLYWVNPPVVNDEFELRYFIIGVRDFFVAVKRLSHDRNKHVEHMYTHYKRQSYKHEIENRSHWPITIL